MVGYLNQWLENLGTILCVHINIEQINEYGMVIDILVLGGACIVEELPMLHYILL